MIQRQKTKNQSRKWKKKKALFQLSVGTFQRITYIFQQFLCVFDVDSLWPSKQPSLETLTVFFYHNKLTPGIGEVPACVCMHLFFYLGCANLHARVFSKATIITDSLYTCMHLPRSAPFLVVERMLILGQIWQKQYDDIAYYVCAVSHCSCTTSQVLSCFTGGML